MSTRHLIIFIFFSALAFVFLMCSSQFILVSNVSQKKRCSIFILCLVVIGNFLRLNMIALVDNSIHCSLYLDCVYSLVLVCGMYHSVVCVADFFDGFFLTAGDSCHLN
jgi:hypothetical protein